MTEKLFMKQLTKIKMAIDGNDTYSAQRMIDELIALLSKGVFTPALPEKE